MEALRYNQQWINIAMSTISFTRKDKKCLAFLKEDLEDSGPIKECLVAKGLKSDFIKWLFQPQMVTMILTASCYLETAGWVDWLVYLFEEIVALSFNEM